MIGGARTQGPRACCGARDCNKVGQVLLSSWSGHEETYIADCDQPAMQSSSRFGIAILRRGLSQIPSKSCPSGPLTVLYDGACPLCRREIGIYQGLQARAPVSFVDVNDADARLPEAASKAELLSRFHVREPDGRLLSGANAFLALWERMPGWRWLAFAGRAPGAAWAMEHAYVFFLKHRPMLQRWAQKLDSK